jgi:hypothetical protein
MYELGTLNLVEITIRRTTMVEGRIMEGMNQFGV